MKKRTLILEQTEKSLGRFAGMENTEPPMKGWIRAIRDALGMSARQLANRMGVAQQAVSRIERDELSGSVTIKTMRKAAEALDCAFVYGFVPRRSLKESLQSQAELYAKYQLTQVSQTMLLEAQELSSEENQSMLDNMVSEITSNPPANLWDVQ